MGAGKGEGQSTPLVDRAWLALWEEVRGQEGHWALAMSLATRDGQEDRVIHTGQGREDRLREL